MSEARPPFSLFEGDELLGVFASEKALFREVEAPDVDLYTVIDPQGAKFAIRTYRPIATGFFDKLADLLGAPHKLQLVAIEDIGI